MAIGIDPTIETTELKRIVGRYLGYARSGLTGNDLTDVTDCIESGFREVIWHQFIEDGETVPHVWSFMREEATITTIASTKAYVTTDTFRQMRGSVVVTSGTYKGLMSVISEGDMRALHVSDTTEGPPKYISVLGNTTTVHPIPDANGYEIKFMAAIVPAVASEISISTAFSELVTTSCLAAADKLFNKETTANAERFQVLLQAAVKYDRQITDIQTEQVWPDDNTSSLELNKRQLKSIIGRFKDFPADTDLWSVGQKAEVKDALQAGLRKFYNPIVLPNDLYPHEWSFLKPVVTFGLKTDQIEYDLPDDFAMMDGPLVYAQDENILYTPIAEIGENYLRRRIQRNIGSSRPVVYATWADEYDENEGTVWKIGFDPPPNADMDVTMRYKVNPIDLAADVALPAGGPQYTQTIIEACLSAVEISMGKKGVHTQEFEKLLVASVQHDRNASTADNLDTDDMTAAYGYGYDDHIVTYGDLDIT